MNIEDVFRSRVRMKILRLIEQFGELNVSDLARRLKVNYDTTDMHLKALESEGILQCRKYGRIRLYRFNLNSAKAKAVQNLLETWEKDTQTDTRPV